jgi:hypothetical protein
MVLCQFPHSTNMAITDLFATGSVSEGCNLDCNTQAVLRRCALVPRIHGCHLLAAPRYHASTIIRPTPASGHIHTYSSVGRPICNTDDCCVLRRQRPACHSWQTSNWTRGLRRRPRMPSARSCAPPCPPKKKTMCTPCPFGAPSVPRSLAFPPHHEERAAIALGGCCLHGPPEFLAPTDADPTQLTNNGAIPIKYVNDLLVPAPPPDRAGPMSPNNEDPSATSALSWGRCSRSSSPSSGHAS